MRLSQTRQIKRGKNPRKLSRAVDILMAGEPLPERYQDHPLRGDWKGRRDCHLETDWVLIYRLSDTELRLERTGNHSDLFG